MGYIRRDFTAPAIAKWQYSLKFKNTILKHFPTTTINGVKVFASLYLYKNGVGVLKTPAHLKIYKLLGIKVADLEKGPYDGIENTYLYVTGTELSYSVTPSQVQTYIELNSPQVYPLSKDPFNSDPTADTDLNPDIFKDNPEWTYDENGEAIDSLIPEPQWDKDGWITTYLTYNPPVKADVPESISDSEILGLIEAGDRTNIHFDDEEDHPLTFVSLLDTANVLFENKVRIVQKTIEERTTHTYVLNKGALSSNGVTVGRYLKTAVIEYKFRRIRDAHDPMVDELVAKIESEVAKLSTKLNEVPRLTKLRQIKLTNTFGDSLDSSVSKQLIRMYYDRNGYSENDLSYNRYLMYDAMATLKAKDFCKIFSKQIKQGHTLKKVKWYKKLLVIVIDIIVIVVAVVLIMTGNLAAAAMVLSFGAMLQSGLAYYWAKHGDPAAANYAMGHAEFLGTVAMAVGIIAGVQGAYEMLAGKVSENMTTEAILAKIQEVGQEAITDAMIQAAVVQVKDVTLQQVIDYVIANINDLVLEAVQSVVLGGLQDVGSMTTGQMLMTGVNTLNKGFSLYMQYVDPSQDKLADKKAELEATQKELEDTAGPDTLDTIEIEYSDPYNNWIDMNEKMQNMCYIMTQGKNRLLMNKYYNSGY